MVVIVRQGSRCEGRYQMFQSSSAPAVHPLLNRRGFLQTAGGLGSIALVKLLADQGLLAEPIRPRIRPEAPLAPRPPHFEAKAKRVLIIFSSGTVSHL